MGGINFSSKRKKTPVDELDEAILLEERRKHLYNTRYRKSSLFRISWLIRIVYFILALMAVIFHEKPIFSRQEIVTNKRVNMYVVHTRMGGHQRVQELSFQTAENDYTSTVVDSWIPLFNVDDTLVIQRNILGKATYFSTTDLPLKFSIDIHYVYYVLVLLFTLVSTGFNDGVDRMTSKILLIVSAIDLIAMACYFMS